MIAQFQNNQTETVFRLFEFGLGRKKVPMKSMMMRPSEKRPVGWWKKVSPYGGKADSGRLLGVERAIEFPVSAMESPKLMIDLKFRHVVSELTLVTKRVDKKKPASFVIST